MEYVIDVLWDDEANVWVATNDVIPISVEAESFGELIEFL